MRISDWSSDVCSSDLHGLAADREDERLGGPGPDSGAELVDGGVDLIRAPFELVAGDLVADRAHETAGVAQLAQNARASLGGGIGRIERCPGQTIRRPFLQESVLGRMHQVQADVLAWSFGTAADTDKPLQSAVDLGQIGRASCRERGGQYL